MQALVARANAFEAAGQEAAPAREKHRQKLRRKAELLRSDVDAPEQAIPAYMLAGRRLNEDVPSNTEFEQRRGG